MKESSLDRFVTAPNGGGLPGSLGQLGISRTPASVAMGNYLTSDYQQDW